MKNAIKILSVVLVIISIYAFATTPKKETIKVVIDASHGGDDFGATHKEFMEKTIVSQISSKISQFNKKSNVEIYFTRTADSFLTLDKRVKIINDINPDLFLSLHVNNNINSTSYGIEGYVANESLHKEKSLQYATALTLKLAEATNLNDRGAKSAPFYLLKHANCPGVLLELGFLSNSNDRNYITNNKNQDVIAQTILSFISQIK